MKDGLIASTIAAHAADLAKGYPGEITPNYFIAHCPQEPNPTTSQEGSFV